MIKVVSCIIIIICIAAGNLIAQPIITFDFSNLNIGNEVTAVSKTNDPNLTQSTISRGTGISFLDAAWLSANAPDGELDPGLFNSYNWTGGSSPDPDDYLEFTISPNSGYQFSISSIVLEHERNGGGPTNFVLRTSDDSFTSNQGGVHTIPIVQERPVVTVIPLSLVDVNTPLTVRLYAYGGSSYLGTWGLGIGSFFTSRNHIVVNGFVIPENTSSIFTSVTALNDFYFLTGTGPSIIQTFNVIGTNLTGDLTVTGTSGYEVSLDSSNFLQSVQLVNTGGNISSTAVYVRLKSGLTIADYSESITITGGGASQKNISCTGFVSPYNLVINEFLSDASTLGGTDSNNDGVSSYLQDQFIELVNIGSSDLNLSGFTIRIYRYNTLSTRLGHVFSSVNLPVNDAIVVFGGGSLTNFSVSLAQTASTGNLLFGEANGKITLSDGLGRRVAVYSFGPEGAENQSLARNPDFTGSFVKHSTINGNIISPGRKNTDNEPLPVELQSFSAMVSEGGVRLEWRTETEVNNYGFEIERTSMVKGQKSEVWETIGFVAGNGNSNSPKDYAFDDNNVTASKYTYRLKQIDNDGKYNYSKTVEVDLSIPVKFELSQNYPNPFNPATTIRFSLPQAGFVKLTIFNVLGEEVTTLVSENREAGIHTFNFNASEFNSGMYLYKLESNGNVQTKKMMLLK